MTDMLHSNHQRYLDGRCAYSEALLRQQRQECDDRHGLSDSGGKWFCTVTPLDWDTRVLGVDSASVGDIFHSEGADFDELAEAVGDHLAELRVGFASLRLDAGALDLLRAFTGRGWKIVDILDIFGADLPLDAPSAVRTGQTVTTDLSPEQGMAFFDRNPDLFSSARIHCDKNIRPEQAEKFYRELLSSQLAKEQAVRVGIFDDSGLAGLAVGNADPWLLKHCGCKLGYLWLIGVREQTRGTGLGASLLRAFIEQASARMDFLEVGTQITNIPARRLYLSAGLKPVATAVTLHHWA